MSKQYPAELREQLEAKRDELAERVERVKADIGRGLEADSAEQAGQLENSEVLDAIGNEARQELQIVLAALNRMDEGTYGSCRECGEAINPERLEARPWSVRCIRCAA